MTNSSIKTNRQRGFTIVELLIVIIVIGILATLVLIAYNNVQGQARDTKRQGDATSLKSAIETYKTQSASGYYPHIWPNTMVTAAGTGTANSASVPFQADISVAANYTNGTTTVSIPTNVSTLLNPGTTPNNSTPSGANPNYIEAKYCPAGSDWTTATGVEMWYYSESKKAVQPSVTAGQGLVSGTGCDLVTPGSVN